MMVTCYVLLGLSWAFWAVTMELLARPPYFTDAKPLYCAIRLSYHIYTARLMEAAPHTVFPLVKLTVCSCVPDGALATLTVSASATDCGLQVLYALTAGVAGWISARSFKMMDGTNWVSPGSFSRHS